MATESGTQDPDVRRTLLGQALGSHPGRFDFFQVVRLLELLYANQIPVGEWGPPALETVRFGVNNSLAFPPSQIHSLTWGAKGPPLITVNFFGLTGPMGVLPLPYTELVRDRAREKDRSLADFLDMFHHRALSLFYQAWKKYRFFVPYERDRKDRFSGYMRSLVGLGTGGLQDRQLVGDESFLYYSGLLSLQPRSVTALQQVLSDYFDVPVDVQQFIGAWYAIPAHDQCCLDAGREYADTLGGAIAGDEIWDHQSRARVVIGPVRLAHYRTFLPTGRAYESLRTMLRFFSGDEIQFEVQLVLARDEVPQVKMEHAGNEGPLLGWTTWIKSGDGFGRDPADTVLLLN